MDECGVEQVVDHALAMDIYEGLIAEGYVKKEQLTDKYYDDKAQGELILADEVKDCADSIIVLLDQIYNPEITKSEDALKTPVEATTNENMNKAEFKALWNKINKKSAYIVDFKMDELTEKAIAALDKELRVSQIYFKVETGEMAGIKSKQELSEGTSFKKDETKTTNTNATASQAVKYDW